MFAWLARRRKRNRDAHKQLKALFEASRRLMLDKDSVFHFPMFGEEVHLYLPYAGFDFIQNTIVSKADFFEGDILRKIRKNYFNNQPCTVLDIGGNIGSHAVFFAKFCKANVFTFEPQKALFRILQRNLELNNVNVESFNFALGEYDGCADIEEYNTHNTGGTAFQKQENGDFLVKPLDSLNLTNIHFIKIDVEGFESMVLRGAKQTNANSRPIIWIEIFDENKSTVFPILHEMGYELKEQLASADYIFMPKIK